MHKKFISILLSIILMMTTLTAVAKDSVEMKNSETDIEINLIKSLGIIEAYENGDFGENDAMTRGELAIAIMKFLKIDESKEEYKDSYYEDVKSDMDCFNAVKILTDLEIFNKGGMFRPSDRATMDETIKIVVTALGYDIVAGDNGGYPNGYMKVARNIALTDGVNDLNTADYVTRGTVARLCFNGFDIKPLYGYKSGEKVIITESNLTFGEEYYHLKSINGIVEKTEITGLFDTDKLSSNKILVADTMFNIGDDTDITSLLGQYVTAYYTDINNTYTLICMDESRNKKLTLTDENEPSLNGKRLEYYQDGRQKYVNLGKGAIPIYNNTVKIDGEIIIPKDGSITLVDNNDNGDYDVIKTIEYFSGVVENKTEENISIRSFKNIKIDKDKKVEYKGDIKVGSIASVIESENYLGFVVSEEKVSGKISEVFDRNNIIKIIVNGKKYQLTENFDGFYTTGKEVSLFLNITGKVVYIEEKADDVSFAYIVNYNRENSMDTSVLLRLYEGVTQLTTVTLADKVKIDGKIYKVNRIKLAGEKGADGDIFLAKEQLVVLKKNSGNKVISIDTINKGTGGDDDKLLVTASGSHRYKRSSGNFGGKAFVTDNSKIFGVPSDKNEEKGYGVYKPDQLINDAIYKMIAYSVDDKALLSAAVVFEATEEEGGINDETGLAVVKNLVDILDSDGNQKKQISMLFEGTDIAKVITDTYKIEDIKIGDTIRFGTDMSGEINKIEKIYDVETGMAKGNPIGNFISCFGVTAGTVTRKGGEFITVARTNDPSDISMHYATRHKIYVVNMGLRETTVTSGNINDIKDAKLYGDEASIAVVHARFGDPKTIVVYNK